MAFDPTTKHVYVTSGVYIYKVDLFKGTMDTVVKAVGTIHDVRVDHVCKKLYWAMYYQDVIMVSNLDGTHQTQLMSADYIRGLTLDIKNGYVNRGWMHIVLFYIYDCYILL